MLATGSIAQRTANRVTSPAAPCERCDHLEERLARLTSFVAAAGMVPASAAGVDALPEKPLKGIDGTRPDLSLRQYQIGVLLAQGKTNAEIGTVLFLGVNSVKTHVKGLYRALGVRNRTEAALWFVRSGQVDA